MATLGGTQIKWIARYGKNGRKYVWENPTQEKLDELIKKYEVDQVTEDGVWLQW